MAREQTMRKTLGGGLTFQTGITCLADRGPPSLQAVSLRKPAIEKEARLRPQHFFTFGSGDCSFANASEGFKGWGADEVAPPRS